MDRLSSQQRHTLFAETQRFRWPPKPIKPTLLGTGDSSVYDLYQKPKDTWSESDWRCYAEYLELSGNLLSSELNMLRRDNFNLRKRLKRSKSRILKGSLLTKPPATKRGAPKKESSSSISRGEELLKLKSDYNLPTNKKAVELSKKTTPSKVRSVD
jgi:hypothetical protein